MAHFAFVNVPRTGLTFTTLEACFDRLPDRPHVEQATAIDQLRIPYPRYAAGQRHNQQHQEDDANDQGWPISLSTTEGPDG